MKSAVRRAAVIGVTAMVPLALATPAFAHVTVSSTNAKQGGYAKLTFRMPNEEDAAKTTKLEVQLPTATPFASVSVQPHQGWSFKVTKSTLATPLTDDDGNKITEAVSDIVWTADADGGLAPGTFDEFNISVGPLPKVDSITFKALQTYSNGDIVRWIEIPASSTDEPEHPAPTLKLAAADDASPSPTPTAGVAVTAGKDDTDNTDNDGTARALGIIGIIVGVIGIGVGFISTSRRRA